MRNLFLTSMTAMLLSACGGFILWPHTVQITPNISGDVTLSESPVTNANIYLHTSQKSHKACSESKIIAKTDNEGIFYLDGTEQFNLFFVLGDPISAWALCIEHEGKMFLGWHAHKIGYDGGHITLSCNLNDPIINSYGEESFCTDE